MIKWLQLLRHRVCLGRIDRNVIICRWKAPNAVATQFIQLLRTTLVAYTQALYRPPALANRPVFPIHHTLSLIHI